MSDRPRYHTLLIIAIFAILFAANTGSYTYIRVNHSYGGMYASPPRELKHSYKILFYDQHYPFMRALYYLHYPLKYVDHFITNVDIELRTNDYRGDPGNYLREAYN